MTKIPHSRRVITVQVEPGVVAPGLYSALLDSGVAVVRPASQYEGTLPPVPSVGPEAVMADHDLYTNADADKPSAICDRNGDVVLRLCKRCHRGEIELEEPCVPPDTPLGKFEAELRSVDGLRGMMFEDSRALVRECMQQAGVADVDNPDNVGSLAWNVGHRIAFAAHRLGAQAMLKLLAKNVGECTGANEALRKEVDELKAKLNTPQLHDFASAVVTEAAHQRERWGSSHDVGKTPEDWLFLVGHLATKASQSVRGGAVDKALHHTISTAAACANWHAALSGADTGMRPGIDPVARGLTLKDHSKTNGDVVVLPSVKTSSIRDLGGESGAELERHVDARGRLVNAWAAAMARTEERLMTEAIRYCTGEDVDPKRAATFCHVEVQPSGWRTLVVRGCKVVSWKWGATTQDNHDFSYTTPLAMAPLIQVGDKPFEFQP